MNKYKLVLFGSVPVMVAVAAIAQPTQKPDPAITALGQMLQEAQHREALALMRAVSAETRVTDLEAEAKNCKHD